MSTRAAMARHLLPGILLTFAVAAFGDLTRAEARDKAMAFLMERVHGRAANELVERKAESDTPTKHFDYVQMHGGVMVYSAYAKVHVRPDGSAVGNVLTFEIADDLVTTPAMSLEDAKAAAARHLLIAGPFVTRDEELVILPKNVAGSGVPKTDVLAWTFLIAPARDGQGPASQFVAIDGRSGAVILSRPATVHAR